MSMVSYIKRGGFIVLMMIFMGSATASSTQTATFAGGCFWCMQGPFDRTEGVLKTTVGYTGGKEKNPTYEEVSSGTTGHREAIEVVFDPKKVSYEKLLDVFWRQIDPTDGGGQFADRGDQYASGIYTHSDEQKGAAERSKEKLAASKRFKKSIVTPILSASEFYVAEAYHQKYYEKSKIKYKFYRYGSGRDQFLKKVWSPHQDNKKMDNSKYQKPDKKTLKEKLTPLQYKVTQKDGTEAAFKNKYWDNKEAGIYVDVVTGEPLFSSKDKYDSKTGWPSFTKTVKNNAVVFKDDFSLFGKRTDVRSKVGDSHLGHRFDDGPAPTGHRYCINSAALEFIPVSKMEARGYGEYLELFATSNQTGR